MLLPLPPVSSPSSSLFLSPFSPVPQQLGKVGVRPAVVAAGRRARRAAQPRLGQAGGAVGGESGHRRARARGVCVFLWGATSPHGEKAGCFFFFRRIDPPLLPFFSPPAAGRHTHTHTHTHTPSSLLLMAAFDEAALRAKLAALTPTQAGVEAVSGWCQFYRAVRENGKGGVGWRAHRGRQQGAPFCRPPPFFSPFV